MKRIYPWRGSPWRPDSEASSGSMPRFKRSTDDPITAAGAERARQQGSRRSPRLRRDPPTAIPSAWATGLPTIGIHSSTPAGRATPGVESVTEGEYRRTVSIQGIAGSIAVRPVRDRHVLELQIQFPDPSLLSHHRGAGRILIWAPIRRNPANRLDQSPPFAGRGEPWSARSGMLGRVRDRGPGRSRPAGECESRDHACGPARRTLWRSSSRGRRPIVSKRERPGTRRPRQHRADAKACRNHPRVGAGGGERRSDV